MATTSFPKPPIKTKCKLTTPKHHIISIIALAIAIVAIIIAAFDWKQMNAVQSNTNMRITQSQQSILEFKKKIAQNQLALQNAISVNQKNISQLLNQGGDSTTQQATAEAIYLIRLAHLNLTMDNNIKLGITLLKMAKQRIDSVTTPATTRLKVAIAHDVATLSTVPQINVTNLLVELDSISNQIAMLPTRSQMSFQAKKSMTTQNTSHHWWDKVRHNLIGLKKLFIVKHFDKPIAPLLMPQQTIYLKDSVRLKISQAQWAVLHRSPKLYRQSLNLAVQWLNQYNQNSLEAQQIIKKLQALATIAITPKIPATLKSLIVLNALSIPNKNNSSSISIDNQTQSTDQ